MIRTTYFDVEEALRGDIRCLQHRNEILTRRLEHLLTSEVIRKYDELDPRTGVYKYDITELDQHAKSKIKWVEFSPDDKICGHRIGDVITHIEYCEKNGIDITSFADGVRYGLEKAIEIVYKCFNDFKERSNDV